MPDITWTDISLSTPKIPPKQVMESRDILIPAQPGQGHTRHRRSAAYPIPNTRTTVRTSDDHRHLYSRTTVRISPDIGIRYSRISVRAFENESHGFRYRAIEIGGAGSGTGTILSSESCRVSLTYERPLQKIFCGNFRPRHRAPGRAREPLWYYPAMATIPSAPPKTKQINGRSLVFALAGKEREYPVYRFSGRTYKYEKPKHNPFQGL